MEESGPNIFTENEKYLLNLLIAISFLSLFGSLFIIMTYVFFRKVRNYAYKLVAYLSIANVVSSIANILSIGTLKTKEEDSLCKAQAFLINFGGLSSIIWTSIIAWSIYSATVLSAKNLRQKNTKFILFGFGFSLIFSIIPFLTNQYGRAGLYCWIKNDETVKDTVMRFIQFYVPLWIALAFNLYAYIKVIRFIKKYISTTLEIRFIHRLKYYPLVLVVCWIFATIDRIYNIFGHEIMILTFLHVTFGGLQGLFNAIVYGTNDQVKQTWKEKMCCCFSWKPTAYARYDGPDNSLKKSEEMKQYQEYNGEEANQQNGEAQNVSLEVQSADLSDKKKEKENKLAVRI